LWLRGIVVLVVVSAGCGPSEPHEATIEALGAQRGFLSRWSGAGHSPCPLDGDCRPSFTPRAERRLTELRAELLDELARDVRPRTLHTIALLDVVTSGGSPESLERAIHRLETARTVGSVTPELENDLAFVRLERWRQAADPFDLVEALEAAETAVRARPGYAAALYNRSLALEALGLWREAVASWGEFEGAETDLAWRADGAARVMPAALRGAEAMAPDSALYSDSILVAGPVVWANQASESILADRFVDARSDARSLAQLGERTPLDAFEAIERAGDRGREVLSNGLRSYGEGLRLWRAGLFTEAGASFRASERLLRDVIPRVATRASIHAANAAVYEGDLKGAETRYAGALAALSGSGQTEQYREIALAAHWGLGMTAGRSFELETSLRHFEEIADYATALGQTASEASGYGLEANMYWLLGDDRRSLGETMKAMRVPGAARGNMGHNRFLSTGTLLVDRYPHTAAFVHREGLRTAEDLPGRQYEAEASMRLASAAARIGDDSLAVRRLALARRLVDEVPDSSMRRRIEAELDYHESLHSNTLEDRDRLDLLTRAIEYFRENVPALLPALHERRAETHLALGETGPAADDLGDAIRLAAGQLTETRRTEHRAALTEANAASTDLLVDLLIDSGRPNEALLTFETSRIGNGRPLADLEALNAMPEGLAIVTYVVTQTGTHAWVARRDGLTSHRLGDSRAELRLAVDRFRAALEYSASTSRVDSLGADLYATLIDPLLKQLDGVDGLIIVADRSLHDLPFAALSEGSSRLVERYTLRHSASLGDALETALDSTSTGAVGDWLAVSGGDVESVGRSVLAPLPGAADEVRFVAEAHPRTHVMFAPPARVLRRALQDAQALHFAGHALSVPDSPLESTLVVPDGGLTAATIRELDLDHLRLVVLSACRTQRAHSSRSGGIAGLSAAFLRAGAAGVIGSLWSVRDAPTAELMAHLHRELAVGAPPARALQAAQRRALETAPEDWSWAAFRYEGG